MLRRQIERGAAYYLPRLRVFFIFVLIPGQPIFLRAESNYDIFFFWLVFVAWTLFFLLFSEAANPKHELVIIFRECRAMNSCNEFLFITLCRLTLASPPQEHIHVFENTLKVWMVFGYESMLFQLWAKTESQAEVSTHVVGTRCWVSKSTSLSLHLVPAF